MHIIPRTLERRIRRISQTFRVLLLTGPRQVGKTTLLKQLAESESRNYVSLDDRKARHLAKTDPDGFFQTHKFPLLIDEIQYAPELFSNIKMIVDEEKDKRGLFWLTGSQKCHLMQNVSESLAGRVIIVDMLGLSQAEIKGRSDTSRPFVPTLEWIRHAREAGGASESMTEVYERVWRGTFPELYQSTSAG